MRILFVSGVAVGGSARSTGELAQRLARHGHAVGVLFAVEGAPRRRAVHKRGVNLAVKLSGTPIGRPIAGAAAMIARRVRRVPATGIVETWETVLPENAFPRVHRSFRPDVVVASSIDRMAWRRIRDALAANRIPSVLYVREQHAFGHLTISEAPPDRLVANASVHAAHAARLGYDAVTIPSIVTVEDCLVESSRARVLFVNPIPLQGLEIALALAGARPDLLFAFAESWLLAPTDRAALMARLSELPNVELRAFDPDVRSLYRDARILLAPYLSNGRPRVVLEAQANGIPVLASDLPALREAVGSGGVVVGPDAPLDAWLDALSELLDDDDRYRGYVESARRHAGRDEADPDSIAARFEQVLADLIVAHGGAGPSGAGRADAASPP